jgi:hypothetical protein
MTKQSHAGVRARDSVATVAAAGATAWSQLPAIAELCTRHNRRPATDDWQVAPSLYPKGREPTVSTRVAMLLLGPDNSEAPCHDALRYALSGHGEHRQGSRPPGDQAGDCLRGGLHSRERRLPWSRECSARDEVDSAQRIVREVGHGVAASSRAVRAVRCSFTWSTVSQLRLRRRVVSAVARSTNRRTRV